MFTRGGFYTKTSRRKSRGSEEVIDILMAFAHGDPDKTLVMKHIGQLVVAGHANVELLDNGEAEVRFTSGETFLLAATSILRLT